MKTLLFILGGLFLLKKRSSKGIGSAKQLTIDFNAPYHVQYRNNIFRKEFEKNLPQLLDINDGTLFDKNNIVVEERQNAAYLDDLERERQLYNKSKEIKEFERQIMICADEPAIKYANEHYYDFVNAYEGFLQGVELALCYYLQTNGQNLAYIDASFQSVYKQNGIKWFNDYINYEY